MKQANSTLPVPNKLLWLSERWLGGSSFCLFSLFLSFLALVATARKTQLPSPPPVIAPVISSSTRSYRCLAGLTRCLLSLTSRRIASQDSLLAALVGFSRRILSPTAVAGFTRWLLSPDSLACCSRPIRSLAALAGLS